MPVSWEILVPLIVAVLAWLLNEESRRRWEQYKRKEESYRELLRTLHGFYVSSQDTQLKQEFLHQVNLCWLYSPDNVIRSAYAFLDTVHTDANTGDDQRESAAGALVAAIRGDLIGKGIRSRTKLTGKDFRPLAPPRPRNS